MRTCWRWVEDHAALFVIVGLAGLALLGAEVKDQQVQQNTFHVAQLRGCHRLNVERAKTNRNTLRDYQLYTLTISLIGESLKHPTRPTTQAERAQASAYLQRISDAALGKEWTPLTLCRPSVDHPASFRAPESVPFADTKIHVDMHGHTILPVELQQALRVAPGE